MPLLPNQLQGEEGSKSSTITSDIVLLVEGKSETNFLTGLLKYLDITDVQTREVEGKGNYPQAFQAFLNDPSFYGVKAYAIIRDADDSAEAAFSSAKKMLSDNQQPCLSSHAEIIFKKGFPNVGIFIIPGNNEKGMIEDLFLKTMKNHPIMPHVESYMTNIKVTVPNNYPKNESKAKAQAFLAGMYETVPNVGWAALKKYWNFDSDEIGQLRGFLLQLVEVRSLDEYF